MLYNETLPPTLIKNTFTQFRIQTHLFVYLESVTVTGSGNLARAVNYTLNGKKYYYTYLENGDLPIDNNRAEQIIRPFTVGYKKGLFSNTARGEQASATYIPLFQLLRLIVWTQKRSSPSFFSPSRDYYFTLELTSYHRKTRWAFSCLDAEDLTVTKIKH